MNLSKFEKQLMDELCARNQLEGKPYITQKEILKYRLFIPPAPSLVIVEGEKALIDKELVAHVKMKDPLSGAGTYRIELTEKGKQYCDDQVENTIRKK